MHSMSLSIGSITLDGRAVLAPMSGVTDHAMRWIARRFGASLVVSEMVASDSFVKGDEETRLRAEGSGIDPHVVQLAGRDPYWMSEAARLAEASGAAIIDINMGCPAKKVTGGYAGSALMRDLDLALKLVDATIAAVSIPVTVKMRLGWDEETLNAPELAHRCEAAGVKLVTIHGRTRCQFYKGAADWDAISAVKNRVGIPVIANGDCSTLETAEEMLRKSGADGVMIGRAAMGQPWLVGMIARGLQGQTFELPSLQERRDAAIEHYQSLLSAMGHEAGIRHARKHLAAYADVRHSECPVLSQSEREDLVTTHSEKKVIATLINLFDRPPLRSAA